MINSAKSPLACLLLYPRSREKLEASTLPVVRKVIKLISSDKPVELVGELTPFTHKDPFLT